MNHSVAKAVVCAMCMSGCATQSDLSDREVVSTAAALVGDALPNLTSGQLALFNNGKAAFNEVETLEDGLGPIFNDKSCGNCHSVGATGGAGTQYEHRAGQVMNGNFDSLTQFGGQLFEIFTVTNLTGADRNKIPNCTLNKNGETIPPQANVQAHRRTTALFGLGLVDNTPDSTFVNLAASEPAAIRGHANMVHDIASNQTVVGKFGWKAQVPTLHQFSGDAYLNEMGITNPEFPNEQSPMGIGGSIAACDLVPGLEDDGTDVQEFTDFMSMLAPIAPAQQNAQTQAGSTVFSNIGCDGCHARDLRSGSSSSITALNNQTYHPYSDFLLHDMGSLGDGIGDNGTAGLTEMRTAPLWGLQLVDTKHQLLHDGRATSLEDAITRHDGQGHAASVAFAALNTTDRNNLLAFLKSL